MKTVKLITLTLTLSLLALAAAGQNNCSKYYPFEESSTSTYEMRNANGKSEGSMTMSIKDIRTSGASIKARVNSEIFDKKGKALMASEYDMTCDGNTVHMDFKSLMNSDMMRQFKDMEIEFTGTDVEFPNKLSAGQSLPDASMQAKMNMGGLAMNMTTNITDRKVQGKERLSTPAGTFDCMVITQSSKGKVMMKFESRQKFWIAEGVGLVKSEDYNAKGKLQGTTLLTAFSK